MKNFSDEALDALERGDAIVSGAAAVYCDPPIYLWGGYGQLTLAGDTGDEVYEGVGDRGMIQVSGGALGGAAQSVGLVLSGIDAAALDVLDADEVKRAPVVVRRLIFSGDGKTLHSHHVFARGRVDELKSTDTIGGPAAINVMVEGAARGLGRRGGRLRSDSDQRLVSATDGFFRNVSFAGEKILYWGGKRPARAAGVLGGVVGDLIGAILSGRTPTNVGGG